MALSLVVKDIKQRLVEIESKRLKVLKTYGKKVSNSQWAELLKKDPASYHTISSNATYNYKHLVREKGLEPRKALAELNVRLKKAARKVKGLAEEISTQG